ncbi:MAG: hypothetical protein DRG30_02850 [Epsilonproteobacteria bacterium]|nr:MAG: hypothetical protein DRG30_02850 [Campylobacterota bacterium]
MFKTFFVVFALFFLTQFAVAELAKPNTFVPNRGLKPSKVLAANMRGGISGSVKETIYIWSRQYEDPVKQISDLMKIFKYLSDTPVMPKQMLENKEFELYRVLDVKKMIKALDLFQKDVNRAYRSLFEYTSYIIGSKDGDYNRAYKVVTKDIKRMINSYNHLAKVTNKQYRQKIMPYYTLNKKKKGLFEWLK